MSAWDGAPGYGNDVQQHSFGVLCARRLRESTEYCAKALAISERELGTEYPETATVYNNMALVYKGQGDYKKALEFYGKACAISEHALGTGHPDMATAYNNMALVYKGQGDYEKALEYYKKANVIFLSVF